MTLFYLCQKALNVDIVLLFLGSVIKMNEDGCMGCVMLIILLITGIGIAMFMGWASPDSRAWLFDFGMFLYRLTPGWWQGFVEKIIEGSDPKEIGLFHGIFGFFLLLVTTTMYGGAKQQQEGGSFAIFFWSDD